MTRRTEAAAWAALAVALAFGVMLFVWQAPRPGRPVSQVSGGALNQFPTGWYCFNIGAARPHVSEQPELDHECSRNELASPIP